MKQVRLCSFRIMMKEGGQVNGVIHTNVIYSRTWIIVNSSHPSTFEGQTILCLTFQSIFNSRNDFLGSNNQEKLIWATMEGCHTSSSSISNNNIARFRYCTN